MKPGGPRMHAMAHDPLYPDSDGKPMCENTLQFDWIVTLRENLNKLLPNAFVGGNLLWYAVEGEPKKRMGPDVLIALGRPKGYRGSYKTWCEEGVVPQVLFEVLSPGNRLPEMLRKLRFYEEHGVQEYYVLDPDDGVWTGWTREGDRFVDLDMQDHTSPLLNVRFTFGDGEAHIFKPDGEPFAKVVTIMEDLETAKAELAARDAELAARDAELAARDAELAARDATAARQAALIAELQAKLERGT